MPKLVELEARSSYRLWLRYEDGTEGEVDLAHLIGGEALDGWKEESVFRTAAIGPHGEVTWGEQIDLCSDALYLRLTGKAAKELMPGVQLAQVGG